MRQVSILRIFEIIYEREQVGSISFIQCKVQVCGII